MTENEEKVLANVEGMAQWLDDYQKEKFNLSGDLTGRNHDLMDYFSDFHREFSDFERGAEESELLAEIKKSSVVFLGDFHNLRQSQKLAAELIKKMVSQDFSFKTLAMEFLPPHGQRVLEKYQSGKISEELFLKKIRFKNWGDFHHWEGYKKVLAIAKKKGLKIFGINKTYQMGSKQAKKDQLFVRDLEVIFEAPFASKLIVHIGNAHLAQNHLLKKMFDLPAFKNKKIVRIILQNIPQVYFSALRRYKSFHLPKILKISDRVYQIGPAPLLTQLLSNIENLQYSIGANESESIWVEGDLTLEIVRRWADLLELRFDPNGLPELFIGEDAEAVLDKKAYSKIIVIKEFRLKKVLEKLAGAVFGGPKSFLYFCSKLFIPERRPENETERVGEKMFIDFLKGRKPVIPRS